MAPSYNSITLLILGVSAFKNKIQMIRIICTKNLI